MEEWLIVVVLLQVGLKLLSRVRPSESFLKSISRNVTEVEVIHPTRGSVVQVFLLVSCTPSIHNCIVCFAIAKHPSLLDFIPCIFSFASSEDNLESQRILDVSEISASATPAKEDAFSDTARHLWVLSSEKLDDVIHGGGKEEGLSDSVLSVIREMYGLDKEEVLKYRQFQ